MPTKKKPTYGPDLLPWLVEFNNPMATIEGHAVKIATDPHRPVAHLWVGGGTQGKQRQMANACLVAEAPMLVRELRKALRVLTQEARERRDSGNGEEYQDLYALVRQGRAVLRRAVRRFA